MIRAMIASLVFINFVCAGPLVARAETGTIIAKALLRYLGKGAGQTTSEQVVKGMTKELGEQILERTTAKIVREGGEESLVRVGELVAKHGPNVIRAIDNAPSSSQVLKLLDELPATELAAAVSRLSAGATGRELAELSTKMGIGVLKSEMRHPGLGLKLARGLGPEGAEVSLKLTQDQALRISQHIDDMAALPAAQRSELLNLISNDAERFSDFMGRFVEKNPGKVLFTAAGTTILLANAEAILGGGEIARDQDGTLRFVPKAGLIERAVDKAIDAAWLPGQFTLWGLCGLVVLFVGRWLLR